ncbi:hypothetical protein [Streptomyces sp. NPDC059122]|uniref:hypothetical protein n=1 Tax=Streptomyces sp. NPDC059122 TaxID=3346732 RepID=UPI0036AAF3FF
MHPVHTGGHNLRDRLAGTGWYDDEFASYGLIDSQITTLRTWALEWAAARGGAACSGAVEAGGRDC